MAISLIVGVLPELLDIILDNIDMRQDLLSLALSCSFFASVIIPDRLEHHTIVASPYHTLLWEHLSRHRRLALYARKLSLHDDPRRAKPRREDWHLPSSVRDTSHKHIVGQCDTRLFASALRNMQNVSWLSLHYVRTPHLIAAMPALPDILPVVFTNLTSLEHLSTSTRLAPSDDAALCSPSHPIWKLHGLRSFNIDIAGSEAVLWPLYESVLSASPGLQDLHLPTFFTEKSMDKLCDFNFPSLQRFGQVHAWSTQTTNYVIRFLRAHPTIDTLRWPSVVTAGFPCDTFSTLKHLSAPHPSLLCRCMEEKTPAVMRLETLADISLAEDLLPSLNAIDPSTLRLLHIQSLDDYTTLRSLASRFTGIVELRLPQQGAWRNNSRLGTRLTRAMLRPWYRELQLLSLAEVMLLFPQLEIIRGIQCPPRLDPEWDSADPRAAVGIKALKESYPRLRRINDWCLC